MPTVDLPTRYRSEIPGAGDLRDELLRRLRAAVQGVNGHRTVIRVSVRTEEAIRPTDVLRVNSGVRTLWSGRDMQETVATMGVAEELEPARTAPVDPDGLAEMLETRTQALPDDVRYYGGLRFDAFQRPPSSVVDPEWEGFADFRFILPRFELIARPNKTELACTIVGPGDVHALEPVLRQVAGLRLPEPRPPRALPSPTERTDIPTRAAWIQAVKHTLAQIDSGRIDKAVLARRASLLHDGRIDPYDVMDQLQPATPQCFHFAFQYRDQSAFLGASPERLFRRDGRTVQSEAVAGTRSRATSRRDDEALRDELLESDKDRREHAFVEAAVRNALSGLCEQVTAPGERDEMRLSGGRHIWTRVGGTLAGGVRTGDLLSALHPTPAVGGVPRSDALALIRETEAFDRGWYAGPVGWVGRDDAEFAVAIRSGLVAGPRLHLFSGAGIVQGSRPRDEWDEIEQKIGGFLSLVD